MTADINRQLPRHLDFYPLATIVEFLNSPTASVAGFGGFWSTAWYSVLNAGSLRIVRVDILRTAYVRILTTPNRKVPDLLNIALFQSPVETGFADCFVGCLLSMTFSLLMCPLVPWYVHTYHNHTIMTTPSSVLNLYSVP